MPVGPGDVIRGGVYDVTRHGSREPSPKRTRPDRTQQAQTLPVTRVTPGRAPKRKSVTRHGSREPSPKRTRPDKTQQAHTLPVTLVTPFGAQFTR